MQRGIVGRQRGMVGRQEGIVGRQEGGLGGREGGLEGREGSKKGERLGGNGGVSFGGRYKGRLIEERHQGLLEES